MAHPLELCPTGRDCVACPHPGAFWAPVGLWTGVLGVKGVLEASADPHAIKRSKGMLCHAVPGNGRHPPFPAPALPSSCKPQLRLLPLQRPLSLPSLVRAPAFSIVHPKLFS